jgi:formate-dependent nitrite reductase membrane component NrfD
MQGCPYDALYIDPDTDTAAKCHYCAHRVEVGLEPACVVVCPARAIIAGDLDDPGAPIARLVATEPVQVRKPEQGTRPKLFYLGADAAALTPSMQAPAEQYAFATRPPEEVDLVRMVAELHETGPADGGPTRAVYDAPHMARPWGWKVSTYLWTKSVAAGALLVAAGGVLAGAPPSSLLRGVVPPLVALLFLALTGALLVFDLKRPERFHYVLFKSNRRSWLVWGAWILMVYGVFGAVWLVAALAGRTGLLDVLALPTLLLAAASAGYSAFLFGQARGRDLWRSPLLLPHLLVAALAAGAAALLIVGIVARGDVPSLNLLVIALLVALALQAVLFVAELGGAPASADAGLAARLLTRGALSVRFWGGVVIGGVVLPIVLTLSPVVLLGAALALAGLWLYEDLWIRAGQSVPLS